MRTAKFMGPRIEVSASALFAYWDELPISDDMRDEDLEFECPNCGCLIVKKGSWLKVISAFTCTQCETRVRIGYPAKVALFERKKKSSDRAV